MLKFAAAQLVLFFLLGCDPVPVQYPAGSSSYPSAPYPSLPAGAQPASVPQPPPQSQRQLGTSQRGQYIWEKMMEGIYLGGAIGGPYGAGGGLVIGLLTGLFTADSYYTQLNTQIQSEQAKDKELEAQLDQEIERQRILEAELGGTGGNAPPKDREPSHAGTGPAQPIQKEKPPIRKEEPTAVASLGNKDARASLPSSPFKNVEIRDVNGDGVPDLWVYHNPLKPGEIVRQEEDTNGDAKVDTWSHFSDGKLVRREVDTKRNGTSDTVFYYQNDKIAREERDENGTGQVSFRATYESGRLAKLEKDSQGSGKIDHWIYYDITKNVEVVSKEEKDLNGDGLVDLWSYFEDGRLVRRDLNTVGLEIFSKQEQLPSSRPEARKISAPGK